MMTLLILLYHTLLQVVLILDDSNKEGKRIVGHDYLERKIPNHKHN
jgi:hypothetical protein